MRGFCGAPASVCVFLAIVVACDRGDVARHDTASSALIPLDTVESPGALAARHEPQHAFDAAREAIVQKHVADARAALVDAATFFETEARTAESAARPALEHAAAELRALANSAVGEIRVRRVLDRTFARAHAAEASLHLTRAHAAIIRRDNVRAGEELVMSVDHLERAAQDAQLGTDTVVQAAIADTRSLAIEMVKGMEAVPDEVARVTEGLERAMERVVTHTKRSTATD